MKKTALAAGVLAVSLLTGCVKDTALPTDTTDASVNQAVPSAERAMGDYVDNEVIVKFRQGTPQTGILNAFSRMGGKVKEHVVTKAMKAYGDQEGFYVVQVPHGVAIALEKARGLAEVDYVEPNYIYESPLPVFPPDDVNDPFYKDNPSDNLWGMLGELTTPFQDKYASRAGEAWWDLQPDGPDEYNFPDRGGFPQTGSDAVYVAVIDQGVKTDHPDFQHKDAYGNTAGSNIATDIDYDFVRNDNDPSPTFVDEDHGTHVAGTIGAIGNNGIGVAGVCWKVKIISLRFLDERGYGTAANAAKAVDHATALKKQGYNIVATNNSWGGLSSKTLQTAITRSEEAGILFVAAAGNDNSNNDRRLTYPSCYTNAGIISVASIAVNGTRSGFSNYGAKTVDIAAPGSYIWSTVPAFSEYDPDGDGYGKMSGTSMAAPHVTGAIALYAAAHNLVPRTKSEALAIKEAIMKGARPTQSFIGKCLSNGRLDIHSALHNKDNRGLAAD